MGRRTVTLETDTWQQNLLHSERSCWQSDFDKPAGLQCLQRRSTATLIGGRKCSEGVHVALQKCKLLCLGPAQNCFGMSVRPPVWARSDRADRHEIACSGFFYWELSTLLGFYKRRGVLLPLKWFSSQAGFHTPRNCVCVRNTAAGLNTKLWPTIMLL
jgi:hypothetical protein